MLCLRSSSPLTQPISRRAHFPDHSQFINVSRPCTGRHGVDSRRRIFDGCQWRMQRRLLLLTQHRFRLQTDSPRRCGWILDGCERGDQRPVCEICGCDRLRDGRRNCANERRIPHGAAGKSCCWFRGLHAHPGTRSAGRSLSMVDLGARGKLAAPHRPRRPDRGSLHIPAERFNSDHTAFSGLVLIWISANSRRISSTTPRLGGNG